MTDLVKIPFHGDELIASLPGKVESQGGEGHLYLIRFANEAIKVGLTTHPRNRIRAHHQAGRAMGSEIVELWLSGPHAEYRENEAALIKFALASGGSPTGWEYFTGLDWASLLREARHLPYTFVDPATHRQRLAADLKAGQKWMNEPGGLLHELGRVCARWARRSASPSSPYSLYEHARLLTLDGADKPEGVTSQDVALELVAYIPQERRSDALVATLRDLVERAWAEALDDPLLANTWFGVRDVARLPAEDDADDPDLRVANST